MSRRLAALLVLVLGPGLAAADQDPPAEKPRLALDVGGHTAMIRAVFFIDGDRRLLTVADDRTVRLWDVATGEAQQVIYLPASDGAVRAQSVLAALSPNGQRLAVAMKSPAATVDWVYLLDLPHGKRFRVVKGAETAILSLAWAPNSKALAVGTPAQVDVWDVESGKRVRQLRAPGLKGVRAVAFSPAGDRLAAGTVNGLLRVWELPGEKLLHESEPENAQLLSLAWSNDGKTLAGLFRAGRHVRFWSRDGAPQLDRKGRFGSLNLQFSPARPDELLVGPCLFHRTKKDGWRVRLRFREEADDGDEEDTDRPGFARAVALTRGGLAAWTNGEELVIWDATGARRDGGRIVKEPERTLGRGGHKMGRVGWSKAGDVLVWSHSKKVAPHRAFDLDALAPAAPPAGGFVEEQTARGQRSVTRGGDGEGLVVKDDGKVVANIHPRGFSPARSITFLDDGRVITGGSPGCRLYSAATGKETEAFSGAEGTLAVAARPDGKYFAAAGQSQTLHVYAPERKAPLLSVYPAGKEWIAWTPEGYYAASPGGERLMGWLVSQGKDELPTFHPAARFRTVFHRPDVVRTVLTAGSVARALDAVSKGKEKPVELETVLPPRVRIVTPEPGAAVKAATLQVRAAAEGDAKHPVLSLQLVVDGRPYEPFEGARGFRSVAKPAAGAKEETWDVKLQPGTHQLRVVAKNAVTTAVSDAVEVTCAPAEAAPAADDLRKALHVLAIGINDYPGDLQLESAINDATKLAETLGRHSRPLFPRGVTVHLRTDAKADKAGILEAFDALAKQARPQDVVVVFYAGHGHVEKTDAKFYLLPHGVDVDALDRTAVSETEFKAKLAAVPGQVVLMMDACHAGATKQKGLWARRATSVTDGVQRSFADEEVGVVMWLAAMGNEFAIEKQGHGLFTRAMIDGLAGAAATNKKGEVNLAALDAFVFEKVTEWSDGRQRPNCARPPSVYPFSLSRPGKE